MALDVYVMPLWRFKAGDFRSPIEETLGIKPTIISLANQPRPQPPWYLRLLAWMQIIRFVEPESPESPAEQRGRAVREVDDLKAELSKLTGQTVDWQDFGEVVYNKQFHYPVTLRAFAAWCDHRETLPDFPPAPRNDYHKHPVWKLPKVAQPRFPTLVVHSLHTGYFLPALFEGCFRVEPFKVADHWTLHHDAASTQVVMREITELLKFMATVPEVRSVEENTIPVADARWYAERLQQICELSLEHSLPVIFYG